MLKFPTPRPTANPADQLAALKILGVDAAKARPLADERVRGITETSQGSLMIVLEGRLTCRIITLESFCLTGGVQAYSVKRETVTDLPRVAPPTSRYSMPADGLPNVPESMRVHFMAAASLQARQS